MGKRWLYSIAAVILASCLAVVAFIMGRSCAEVSDANLQDEVEELRSKISDAAVIQRVSRQMEDIAYQQKEVSDQQRERAEKQSALALSMQKKAEEESRAARVAEQNAREAAAEAEYERANALRHQEEAEQQRDAANYAKRITDTLTFRTVGRTLGNMSIDKYASGEVELASKFAYTGWFLMKQYGGNTYQNEIFESLDMCSKSRQSYYTDKGGGVTDICFVPERGVVYVTDYGEVECLYPQSSQKKILLQDKRYDFKGVLADRESVYAISLHGPLLRIGYDGKVDIIPLEPDNYLGLEKYGSDLILISSEKSLLLFDLNTCAVTATVHLDGKLSIAAVSPQKTYLFFRNGSSACLDEKFASSPLNLRTESAVTAVCCDSLSHSVYLGFDNGKISLIDEGGQLSEVKSGHNGRITSLLLMDGILVSTAYDGSMEMVELSSVYNIVAVSLSFKSWPLCMCRMGQSDIIAGASDGSLLMIDTSTDSMAEKLRAAGDYYLTEEEWAGYVGTGITYPSIR